LAISGIGYMILNHYIVQGYVSQNVITSLIFLDVLRYIYGGALHLMAGVQEVDRRCGDHIKLQQRWRARLIASKAGAENAHEGIQSVPGKTYSSPVILLDDLEQCKRPEIIRKAKAYKASSKKFSLTVGKDINLDRVQHLLDYAMVGRMENVKVPYETLREWIKVHWKPIL